MRKKKSDMVASVRYLELNRAILTPVVRFDTIKKDVIPGGVTLADLP